MLLQINMKQEQLIQVKFVEKITPPEQDELYKYPCCIARIQARFITKTVESLEEDIHIIGSSYWRIQIT